MFTKDLYVMSVLLALQFGCSQGGEQERKARDGHHPDDHDHDEDHEHEDHDEEGDDHEDEHEDEDEKESKQNAASSSNTQQSTESISDEPKLYIDGKKTSRLNAPAAGSTDEHVIQVKTANKNQKYVILRVSSSNGTELSVNADLEMTSRVVMFVNAKKKITEGMIRVEVRDMTGCAKEEHDDCEDAGIESEHDELLTIRVESNSSDKTPTDEEAKKIALQNTIDLLTLMTGTAAQKP